MTTAAATPSATRYRLPWTAVRIDDPFWGPRLRTLVGRTLPGQYRQLLESGRLAPLGIWNGPGDPPKAHAFFNSDIAKWLEAVAYAQTWHADAGLRAKAEEIIAAYARVQMADGYIGFFAVRERWTDLRDGHEMYTIGHLIEAAVAWHEALGDGRLLAVMRDCAQHLWDRFGPEAKDRGVCGHPEIELALVRLGECTGEQRWIDLAAHLVAVRGDGYAAEDARHGRRMHRSGSDYYQAHGPVADQHECGGHSVRALYLLAGVDDLVRHGVDGLAIAAEAQWRSATERRMYVTGGFASTQDGERFTVDHDLPNRAAYTETCAAIAGALVAHRRLRRCRDAQAGAILERCLHNGMLAGLSLDGEHYHYANPLEVVPGEDPQHKRWTGRADSVARKAWYGCACCPPNIARILASLGGYIAIREGDDLDLDLHIGCRIDSDDWTLRVSGDPVSTGRCEIRIDRVPAGGRLGLRRPDWSTEVTVDGAAVADDDGYVRIAVVPGRTLAVDFHLRAERLFADPRISDNANRVALRRGPLVYCQEACDHAEPLPVLRLPRTAALAESPCALLPGTVALRAQGQALATASLYGTGAPTATPAILTAVPYALWGNRGPGAMRVWIPE